MKNEIVIDFNHVSKKFKKGQKLLLKQALLDFLRPHKQEDFWAVKDVSFKVKKGEIIGIIGANGSGKSTILKMIAGVLTPTKGSVTVKGRIGPLIELGAGFHPELTGRENIYLNGTVLGLTKKEIDQKYDDIVGFAELEEFIDTPVKHYSSGMYMRLGFAIAININPDILLIDEILAVGDIAFQKKCLEKMQEFRKKGISIIFVSHSLYLINSFCQKVIFVENGQLVDVGETHKITQKYYNLSLMQKKKAYNNFNNGCIFKINSVEILNDRGKKKEIFKFGEYMKIRIYYSNRLEHVKNTVLGLAIYSEFGTCINNIEEPVTLSRKGSIDIIYKSLELFEGQYYLSIGFTQDTNWSSPLQLLEKALNFSITSACNAKRLNDMTHYLSYYVVNKKE